MEIRRPSYFDNFRCIAGACPDSCCKEWDVQVDREAAACYRALPGALGDRLRQVLRDEGGETVMTIEDGRCPMWRQDGLCCIQAELGEAALCHVCREFPRLRHDYGDFVELGLELSCPEAAKFILNAPPVSWIVEQAEESGEAEYDEEAMVSLRATRDTALNILYAARTPAEALTLLLIYGYQAQDELDGGEPEHFDVTAALENAEKLARPGDLQGVLDFFGTLEILTPAWKERLAGKAQPLLPDQTILLARYLVERYWLQAVADYDLTCRVKLIVIACILVGALGCDYTQTAQLFSKEIENDANNVDAILDAAYSCPAFTDDKLLGLLGNGIK